ncbi:MAG: ATP-binding cassette domain-containing protein, partial [Hyphococcus sp.]
MASLLLSLSDTRLTFGGAPLLDGAALEVGKAARIALVGRNGSGKSTLLKIAAGLVEADTGERFAHPGADIRYLPQEPDFQDCAAAEDYFRSTLDLSTELHQAERIAEALDVRPSLPLARASGGEARRVALAAALAGEPDVLLLDEPTNHLDIAAIAWLEAHIKASRAALVVISHDRRFLENLTTATVWLDRGRTRNCERGFAHFES